MKSIKSEVDLQPIFFLWDYRWYLGRVMSEGKSRYRVLTNWPREDGKGYYVAKEKCAFPGERVCVVWEQWRGKNGRGGFRVERELYPRRRRPAETLEPSRLMGVGRVTESAPGVLKR